MLPVPTPTSPHPVPDESQRLRSVHLLGICGTAMAALAGSLKARGLHITGTDDHVYPPMSDHLDALGIPYNRGYRPENIPADTDLVVVGNVIRESNPEAQEMRRRALPYLSMAAAVKRFAIGPRQCVAIVGTHGKTTTTSLAAHALVELGMDPGFLIGGIARNFSSNFRVGEGAVFVIEGDEYDTAYFDKTPKFFKYEPEIVLFTSLEFDHADIYPDLDAIRFQFSKLLESLPSQGLAIACVDDPNVKALLPRAPCPVITYGFSEEAELRLSAWRAEGAGGVFVTESKGVRSEWHLPAPGRHNALNAAAVVALARHLGHEDAAIQRAFSGFLGVKRRQEVRGEAGGVTVLDDFAHHPTAIALTIEAICGAYPGRRLWAVFEPRSFTARSARFQTEFSVSFTGADRVLLAPPPVSDYSASKGARPLDTLAIAEAIRQTGGWAQALTGTEALLEVLIAECAPGDVVLIMSNGGFDRLHERLLQALARKTGSETQSHDRSMAP